MASNPNLATTAVNSTVAKQSTVNIDAILATIRQMESGNNYTVVTSGGSDACGAYQYISSTWQAMFDRALAAGYLPAGTPKTARACQAPPAVQDAVARYDVTSFLNSVGGNVALVPLHWYYPAAISSWPKMFDYVPPGNSISLGNYQTNWMKTYAKISGDPTKYVANSGGQQAVTTSFLSDAEGALIKGALGPLGPALGIVDSGGKVVSGIGTFIGLVTKMFLNWKWILEFVIGLNLIVLGALIIFNDTAEKKAPQIIGEVAKAA